MTKNPPSTPASREVLPIPGTHYVLLPDNRIARLLTPVKKSGKEYLAIYVDKKRTDIAVDAIVEATLAGKSFTS